MNDERRLTFSPSTSSKYSNSKTNKSYNKAIPKKSDGTGRNERRMEETRQCETEEEVILTSVVDEILKSGSESSGARGSLEECEVDLKQKLREDCGFQLEINELCRGEFKGK